VHNVVCHRSCFAGCLTWRRAAGGNSYTTLLACIHPRNSDYDECLSTLQFANRCRNVRNQPRVNYVDQSSEDKDRRIRKLQTEVDTLRTTVDGASCRRQGAF